MIELFDLKFNHRKGAYAAEVMTYNAKYDENANEIKCKDEPHNHNHEDDIGNCELNCPYNICQCDRQFAHNLLANYKMCLNVSVLRLIHFQVY